MRGVNKLAAVFFLFFSILTANASSQWMWHGAFPWVYSHAESSWWYMPLSEYGASNPASGWMWHGAFPWVYSHNGSDWRYMRSTSSDGKFSAWKQSDKKWYSFNEASQSWVVLPGQGDVQEGRQDPAANRAGDTFTIPDLSLEMIWVEPGTFTMGAVDVAEPVYQVTLTDGYWLGKYEVTQSQWKKVMGSHPSLFLSADQPAVGLSWVEVTSFCEKLTEMESEAGRLPAGMAYQLPTEAQWEYACRAGTTTAFSFGDSLTHREANINALDQGFDGGPPRTTVVGKYPANAWGFHDMHGNVYEWCADWFDIYPQGAVRDPVGPADGLYRTLRGGSYGLTSSFARSAKRWWYLPWGSLVDGFRLSLRPASQ